MPHCSGCGVNVEKALFSRNQLSKPKHRRRCKSCVEKNGVATDSASSFEASPSRSSSLADFDQHLEMQIAVILKLADLLLSPDRVSGVDNPLHLDNIWPEFCFNYRGIIYRGLQFL
jgi:hypothetical protein